MVLFIQTLHTVDLESTWLGLSSPSCRLELPGLAWQLTVGEWVVNTSSYQYILVQIMLLNMLWSRSDHESNRGACINLGTTGWNQFLKLKVKSCLNYLNKHQKLDYGSKSVRKFHLGILNIFEKLNDFNLRSGLHPRSNTRPLKEICFWVKKKGWMEGPWVFAWGGKLTSSNFFYFRPVFSIVAGL